MTGHACTSLQVNRKCCHIKIYILVIYALSQSEGHHVNQPPLQYHIMQHELCLTLCRTVESQFNEVPGINEGYA